MKKQTLGKKDAGFLEQKSTCMEGVPCINKIKNEQFKIARD
jgi:hypothetical protein